MLERGKGVFSALSSCLGRRTRKHPAAVLAAHQPRPRVSSADGQEGRRAEEGSEVCVRIKEMRRRSWCGQSGL